MGLKPSAFCTYIWVDREKMCCKQNSFCELRDQLDRTCNFQNLNVSMAIKHFHYYNSGPRLGANLVIHRFAVDAENATDECHIQSRLAFL